MIAPRSYGTTVRLIFNLAQRGFRILFAGEFYFYMVDIHTYKWYDLSGIPAWAYLEVGNIGPLITAVSFSGGIAAGNQIVVNVKVRPTVDLLF